MVFGTVATLLVTFSGAYALSKRNLPFRAPITGLYLMTLFFSGGLIPTYLLIRSLGLVNTRLVLILPIAIQVYYIIIARNFLMTIDQAMEDSAVIDGAGYWAVLFRIMVPLSWPVIAVVALWTAVSHWNAWFDALIYSPDKHLVVLQMLVRDILNRARLREELDGFVEDLDRFGLVIVPPESVPGRHDPGHHRPHHPRLSVHPEVLRKGRDAGVAEGIERGAPSIAPLSGAITTFAMKALLALRGCP